jgi:xanthine/uracil permease
MGNVGSAEAFRQGMGSVAVLGPALGARAIADTIYVIGSTGMAVGGLVAFVLDNTIEGTREERGLVEWEEATEDDTAFASAFDRFLTDD